MPTAAIVPAYQADSTIGAVVQGLALGFARVWVVDDGSTDGTAAAAERAGAFVLSHERNRGKGAALRTGMQAALDAGFRAAMAVDADGQHPPSEALRLHRRVADRDALVIGVRDLRAAGAPRANQLSNGFSNLVLSAFTGQRLSDTQSGLRRYPLARTLALGGRDDGYGYEAEILIRAIAAGVCVAHEPALVLYPRAARRVSHFDSVRDPARIAARVLATVAETRVARWQQRWRAASEASKASGE